MVRSEGGETAEHERRLTFIRRVPLFRDVSPVALDDVAALLQPRPVAAGTIVVREGDQADAMYVIDQGTFLIRSSGHTVARLSTGEYFGEMALVHQTGRTATVQAETDGLVWSISAAAFATLQQTQQVLAQGLQESAARRRDDLARMEYTFERVNVRHPTAADGQDQRRRQSQDGAHGWKDQCEDNPPRALQGPEPYHQHSCAEHRDCRHQRDRAKGGGQRRSPVSSAAPHGRDHEIPSHCPAGVPAGHDAGLSPPSDPPKRCCNAARTTLRHALASSIAP